MNKSGMTLARKEEIRKILADERVSCNECGFYLSEHAGSNHDYVRAIRLEDELLAALDFADSALQGR